MLAETDVEFDLTPTEQADANVAAMLREELRHARPDIGVPEGATLAQLRLMVGAAGPPLSALCLSGGGIRSAAFALGVAQTLARYGLLGKFDYLSTVSGGGYIGGFLTAWRHAAGNDATVAAGLDRERACDGADAPEIAGLRADSNYLTPKLGVLSADLWTAAVLIIRNLLLNWAVFLPFFMGVLLIPWACKHALEALSGFSRPGFLLGGAVAICAGLGVASYGRRRGEGIWLSDGRFVRLVLGPIVVAAMCFAVAASSPLNQIDQWPSLSAVRDAGLAGCGCYAIAWLVAGMFHPKAWARPISGQSDWPGWDLVTWMVAGAIAGMVLVVGLWTASRGIDARWIVVAGISWTMLSVFTGEIVYVGLRSYSARGEMDREWLARSAGWLGAAAATWSVVSVVALFGPEALLGGTKYLVGAVGGLSGLVALALGSSAKTAATTARQAAQRLSLTQVTSIAALVFALMLAILVSWLDVGVGALLMPHVPAWLPPPLTDALGAAILIGLSAGLSYFVNVNRFSLHALYRNRLVRAFLGSARRGKPGARKPDPFTGFDPADDPLLACMPTKPLLHVVNVTLNVVSTDNLAWQERKAESFTMTPLRAGNGLVGYRPTREYGGPNGGISLGTAVAISGAAVSPNMGYHSSPLLGFLLMLFNVRLGWWLGNPAGPDYGREGPRFGLVTLLQELANQTTADGRWVYLSDGGHFDNLGIYEMVRRGCRYIVASDAGCDPKATLEGLGDAVRKVSIDFGVLISFASLDVAASARPPLDGPAAWIGEIWYPGSSKPGWLLYLRPTYQSGDTADIRSYAAANPTFPHESTSEQWFGEAQFEAYRALGAHQMEAICAGGEASFRANPPGLELAELRERAETYLAPDIDLTHQLDDR